ncbi:MAG: hypothetical protein JW881_13290 [Spirochaetales bacterium]|nr:hypothetical protein [Spirochaetales bacterium]
MKGRTMFISTGVFVVLVLAGGCSTAIGAIRDNPEDFAGREVTVAGNVVNVITVPFAGLSIISLEDRTGNAVVFSDKQYGTGQAVVVTGTVVALPSTDEAEDASEKAVNWLRDYLIENDIVDKAFAGGLAGGIVKAIEGIAGGLHTIFFIVES